MPGCSFQVAQLGRSVDLKLYEDRLLHASGLVQDTLKESIQLNRFHKGKEAVVRLQAHARSFLARREVAWRKEQREMNVKHTIG